ncbi:hypothetical protein [Aurantibacillus circumpalustris]|uniref:hypothetical protein n=1 Tax=Aurantibacillus circumpalustris TaxID=3036359 RepID=UPI00295BEE40|nr:hypothetical protein [Aurantibacillus circumpalustris]
MEKVIKKFKLSEEPSDLNFWLTKSYTERLAALEKLKEHYIQFFLDGNRPGFQRVYRVIK